VRGQSALDGFDPNANNSVNSVAVQADGKILAGGAFTSIGGQTRNFIARLDPTTGLADSFDPNANGPVESNAVQPDGALVQNTLQHYSQILLRMGLRGHRGAVRPSGRVGQSRSAPDPWSRLGSFLLAVLSGIQGSRRIHPR
jgi:hypothetical protein